MSAANVCGSASDMILVHFLHQASSNQDFDLIICQIWLNACPFMVIFLGEAGKCGDLVPS